MQTKIRTKCRHLICPFCKARTKLYKLKDGRRKCARCRKIFSVKRKRDIARLKKLSDIIIGFCLDFSALGTAKLFGYKYRDVLSLFNKIRLILAYDSDDKDKLGEIVE